MVRSLYECNIQPEDDRMPAETYSCLTKWTHIPTKVALHGIPIDLI